MKPYVIPAASRSEIVNDRNVRLLSNPVFRILSTVTVAGVLFHFGSNSASADQNWDGDVSQTAGSFLNGTNWFGNYVGGNGNFGFGNGSLHFSFHNSATQTSLVYDFAGWADTNDIVWDSTFNTGLALNGNGQGLNFNQRLQNDSSHTQTIGSSMNLSAAKNGAGHIELNPVNGDLVLNGTIYNDNNKSYEVYGNNSKMLTINTGLRGNSGVDLTIKQFSKVKITAAQSWGDSTHGVNINTGELWMDVGGSLASSSVPINVGLTDTSVAKLWLSSLTGGLSLGNSITVNNSSGSPAEKTIGGLNTSGTSTFNGTITLNGQVNLSAATGGKVDFTNVISGSGQSVVINGYGLPLSGTIIMSAANTYSGSTYIAGGTLQMNSGGSAANSANFYLGETTGTQTATLALASATGGQSLGNAITVRSGSSGVKTLDSQNTSGTNTLSGNVTLNTDLTINQATGGSLAINGNIVNGTGGNLSKTGNGTLTLNGTNSYAGTTTVNAGTLAINGNQTSATGNVAVNASAKLTGTGTIGGAATINATGILAPTAQASGSKMTIQNTVNFATNSIFEWDLNAGTSDPGANASNSGTYGQLAATGAASGTSVFTIVLGTNSYASAFWDTNKSWSNVFTASGLSALNTLFTTFAGAGLTATGSGATAIATAAGEGHFSFSGTTLQWTAVPEPASTLAGLLLGAGLLRRRRA